MEAEASEGELSQQVFQHRDQIVLADALGGANDLKLGDLIDGVDVIDALEAIEVTLMDGIDAQIAGPAIGLRFAPLGDGGAHRPGLVHAHPLAGIGGGAPQL